MMMMQALSLLKKKEREYISSSYLKGPPASMLGNPSDKGMAARESGEHSCIR